MAKQLPIVPGNDNRICNGKTCNCSKCVQIRDGANKKVRRMCRIINTSRERPAEIPDVMIGIAAGVSKVWRTEMGKHCDHQQNERRSCKQVQLRFCHTKSDLAGMENEYEDAQRDRDRCKQEKVTCNSHSATAFSESLNSRCRDHGSLATQATTAVDVLSD